MTVTSQHTHSIPEPDKESKRRCIALFPGAFRPPHINHFLTVVNLASRQDINEVVIIITNRCRHIPGTSKVLDVDIAVRIWSLYLKDLPNVRVEVAATGAVKHALGYFERVGTGTNLLFCLGESDFQNGDGRFKKIDMLSKRYRIKATVIPGSPSAVSFRGTQMRQMLARGNTERDAFMAALPRHLTPAQHAYVWSVCRQGFKETRVVAMQKVRALVERKDLGQIADICVAKDGKTDEVFCVRFEDGRYIFVKYAHDTVKAAKMGELGSLKPRKRLKAEQSAIKWLRANRFGGIELPEVVCFDKETKTLMLTEVCPGGRSLQDDLKQGVFNQSVASKISRFLAQCHTSVMRMEPLWEDWETDLNNWRTMLALRTTEVKIDGVCAHYLQDMEDLRCMSDVASRGQYVNLDYRPKNILVREGRIGVIDFELSSSIGDPAYDFGIVLGYYILWGIHTRSNHPCQQAIQQALIAYRQTVGKLWLTMGSRVVAFAGAGMLYALSNERRTDLLGSESRLLGTATSLLSKGLNAVEDADKMLFDALAGGDKNGRYF